MDLRERVLRRLARAPGQLGLILTGLVLMCLITGLAGLLDVQHRRSVLVGVADHSSPLASAAVTVYQSLSDADATATGAFLAGDQAPAELHAKYRKDITEAAAALSTAAAGAPDVRTATAVAELTALLATLEHCRGRFVCEARGVGERWSAEPLNAIADVLLGTADGLPDAKSLTVEFQAMIEAVMGKTAANVTLRLWHPRGSRIRFVKQVFPDILPLTENGIQVSDLITDYPTGSWGAETRDYHLSVELPAGRKLGEEVLVAHARIVLEDKVVAEGLVPASWTDDAALSTKINPRVAHYTGQQELNVLTQEGLAALTAGREDEATAKLGRAVQLAAESEHHDTLRVLKKIVDVGDGPTAHVRLRNDMEDVDREWASVKSRKTVPWRKR